MGQENALAGPGRAFRARGIRVASDPRTGVALPIGHVEAIPVTSDSEGVALGNLQAIIREARQKLREAQVRGLGYIVRRHRTEALAVRDFRPPIPPEIASYAARLIALLEEADTEEPQRVADYEALIFKLDD